MQHDHVLKKLCFDLLPPTPGKGEWGWGRGEVCEKNICYHVAAFMIPFKVHLTLLYVLYINLEMSSIMKFVCFFELLRCSRTNLAWLPERQLQSTREICINPRWPPEGIIEN